MTLVITGLADIMAAQDIEFRKVIPPDHELIVQRGELVPELTTAQRAVEVKGSTLHIAHIVFESLEFCL